MIIITPIADQPSRRVWFGLIKPDKWRRLNMSIISIISVNIISVNIISVNIISVNKHYLWNELQ